MGSEPYAREPEWTLAYMKRFARAYTSCPALLRPLKYVQHPKSKSRTMEVVRERRSAYQALGRALGEQRGTEDMPRLVHCFRRRYRKRLQEMVRRFLALGFAPNEVLARAPRWVQDTELSLDLLPQVLKGVTGEHARPEVRAGLVAQFTRVVVHALQAGAGGAEDAEAFELAARELGQPAEVVAATWSRVRALALQKLALLVRAGDRPESVPRKARLAPADWLAVDHVLLHDEREHLVTEDSLALYEQLQALTTLFHLAQAYHLELRAHARAWRRAHAAYCERGCRVSLVVLQRRWHELKLQARARLAARWRGDATAPAPHAVHTAVARRFPHVVTDALPAWRDLVAAGGVFLAPFDGEGAEGDSGADEQDAGAPDAGAGRNSGDDLILIEKDIETIDLDELDEPFSSTDVTLLECKQEREACPRSDFGLAPGLHALSAGPLNLPAGSPALPVGLHALPAGLQAVPAGPLGLPAGPLALPAGPLALTAGPHALPAGLQAVPAGPLALPAGPLALPAGPLALPAGPLALPAGLHALPAGLQAVPAGPLALPVGPLALPAGPPALPAGLHALSAGLQAVPAGPLALPAGPLALPAGPLALPAGPHALPAGPLILPSELHALHSGLYTLPSGPHAMPLDLHTMPSEPHALPLGPHAVPLEPHALQSGPHAVPSTVESSPRCQQDCPQSAMVQTYRFFDLYKDADTENSSRQDQTSVKQGVHLGARVSSEGGDLQNLDKEKFYSQTNVNDSPTRDAVPCGAAALERFDPKNLQATLIFDDDEDDDFRDVRPSSAASEHDGSRGSDGSGALVIDASADRHNEGSRARLLVQTDHNYASCANSNTNDFFGRLGHSAGATGAAGTFTSDEAVADPVGNRTRDGCKTAQTNEPVVGSGQITTRDGTSTGDDEQTEQDEEPKVYNRRMSAPREGAPCVRRGAVAQTLEPTELTTTAPSSIETRQSKGDTDEVVDKSQRDSSELLEFDFEIVGIKDEVTASQPCFIKVEPCEEEDEAEKARRSVEGDEQRTEVAPPSASSWEEAGAESDSSATRDSGRSLEDVDYKASEQSLGESGASSEGALIDPKLLMAVQIKLPRLDPLRLAPRAAPHAARRAAPCSRRPSGLRAGQPNENTIFVRDLSKNPDFDIRLKKLSADFVLSKRNMELLSVCTPLSVDVERLAPEPARRRGGARVAKRVELPDIEEVRRVNRRMLTAEVAPLAAPAPRDVPSRAELDALLQALAAESGAARVVGVNRRYCCPARRHRAVNDARHRMSARAGRQAHDTQLHFCKEPCACCCRHLLAQGGREQCGARLGAAQRSLERDVARMLLRKDAPAATQNAEEAAADGEADSPHRQEKQQHKKRKKKEAERETVASGCEPADYQEWTRQRNLVREYFHIRTGRSEAKRGPEPCAPPAKLPRPAPTATPPTVPLAAPPTVPLAAPPTVTPSAPPSAPPAASHAMLPALVPLQRAAWPPRLPPPATPHAAPPAASTAVTPAAPPTTSPAVPHVAPPAASPTATPAAPPATSPAAPPATSPAVPHAAPPAASSAEPHAASPAAPAAVSSAAMPALVPLRRPAWPPPRNAATLLLTVPSLVVRTVPAGERRTAAAVRSPGRSLRRLAPAPAPSAPALTVAEFLRGRDPTNITLLCVDSSKPPLKLPGQYLVVTGLDVPCLRATYWSLEPQHQSRRILLEPEPEPEPAQSAAPRAASAAAAPRLQVRAFASLAAMEGASGSVAAGAGEGAGEGAGAGADAVAGLAAPQRVFLGDKLYLRLARTPLVYARVLTAVSNMAKCRELASSLTGTGCELQLLDLRAGVLRPLRGRSQHDGYMALRCDDAAAECAVRDLVRRFNQPTPPAPRVCGEVIRIDCDPEDEPPTTGASTITVNAFPHSNSFVNKS